ncbi:MAG: pitrilysin family protein [Hyphomonadaceae bacterium]
MIQTVVSFFFQSARRTAVALCLVVAAGSAAAQNAGEWKPETFTLDNGLTAVVLPDHRAPVVTHVLWYRVGSADEVAGKSGLAHFLEHLMFKGTETRPAGEYKKIAARNGGLVNARTSYDYTNYFFRVARDRLPLMMQLEADRMQNLLLGDREVFSERSVVQQERRQMVDSNPGALLDEEVRAKLFAGHPYAVPIVGKMEEVARLSRADAQNWYRTWYGPENAVLVVAGDITAAELKPLAEATFGVIPRRGDLKARSWPAVQPLAESYELKHLDPKVTQANWSRSWIGVPTGDADAEALLVGMQILGGRRTGRLYRGMVEGGRAVSAWGYSDEMEAPGTITVSVSPSRGLSAEQARDEALKIVEDFASAGPTDEELARAKSIIAASAVFRQDNQQTLADWYGEMLITGMPLARIETWDNRIADVTSDDVRSAITRYLIEPHHVDAFLLPEGE